jgi:hypothetical protein
MAGDPLNISPGGGGSSFGTLSAGTFSSAGGAVSDLFGGYALQAKAAGNRIQAQEYGLASDLSLQNEKFTEISTAIKDQQAQRGIETVLGQQTADVAGSGFEASGSALDLLRDSASQGALHKEVLGQQGLIDEAGYKEQAQSYQLMQQSANMAADAADKAASGSFISGTLKGVAASASFALAPATGGLSLAALGALGSSTGNPGGTGGGLGGLY